MLAFVILIFIALPLVWTLVTIGDRMIVFPFALLGNHGDEQQGAISFAAGITRELDDFKTTFQASGPGDELPRLSAGQFDPLSHVTDVVAPALELGRGTAEPNDRVYTGNLFSEAPNPSLFGFELPTQPVLKKLLQTLHPKYVEGTIEHWGTDLRVEFNVKDRTGGRQTWDLNPGAAATATKSASQMPTAAAEPDQATDSGTLVVTANADPIKLGDGYIKAEDGYSDVKLQSAIVIAKVSHSVSSPVFSKMPTDALADLTQGIRAHRRFEQTGSTFDLLQAVCKYKASLDKNGAQITHLFHATAESQIAELMTAQGRRAEYRIDCGPYPKLLPESPPDKEILQDSIKEFESLILAKSDAIALSSFQATDGDGLNQERLVRLAEKGLVSSLTRRLSNRQGPGGGADTEPCAAIDRHLMEIVGIIEKWDEGGDVQDPREVLAVSLLSAEGAEAVAESVLPSFTTDKDCVKLAKHLLETRDPFQLFTKAEIAFSHAKEAVKRLADVKINTAVNDIDKRRSIQAWEDDLNYFVDQKSRYLYSDFAEQLLIDKKVPEARDYLLKSAQLGEEWLARGVRVDYPEAPPWTRWLRASVGRDLATLAILDNDNRDSYAAKALDFLRVASKSSLPEVSRWARIFLSDFMLSSGRWEAGFDYLKEISSSAVEQSEVLIQRLHQDAYDRGLIVEDNSIYHQPLELEAENPYGVGVNTIVADFDWREGRCTDAKKLIETASDFIERNPYDRYVDDLMKLKIEVLRYKIADAEPGRTQDWRSEADAQALAVKVDKYPGGDPRLRAAIYLDLFELYDEMNWWSDLSDSVHHRPGDFLLQAGLVSDGDSSGVQKVAENVRKWHNPCRGTFLRTSDAQH